MAKIISKYESHRSLEIITIIHLYHVADKICWGGSSQVEFEPELFNMDNIEHILPLNFQPNLICHLSKRITSMCLKSEAQ